MVTVCWLITKDLIKSWICWDEKQKAKAKEAKDELKLQSDLRKQGDITHLRAVIQTMESRKNGAGADRHGGVSMMIEWNVDAGWPEGA